ncbi:hypothetical protein ACHQM5_005110 [Ranunculus cassubicifolius]
MPCVKRKGFGEKSSWIGLEWYLHLIVVSRTGDEAPLDSYTNSLSLRKRISLYISYDLDHEARRKHMQEIGFVFTPSDEVLINYYLKYKSSQRSMYLCHIDEVDVYANHPRSLTEQFNPSGGVWYFFTKSRPSENLDIEGVWKFGEKKDVFDNGVKVGVRQELEFYEEGDQNGNGKYKMIEYQLHPATSAPLFCTLIFLCIICVFYAIK